MEDMLGDECTEAEAAKTSAPARWLPGVLAREKSEWCERSTQSLSLRSRRATSPPVSPRAARRPLPSATLSSPSRSRASDAATGAVSCAALGYMVSRRAGAAVGGSQGAPAATAGRLALRARGVPAPLGSLSSSAHAGGAGGAVASVSSSGRTARRSVTERPAALAAAAAAAAARVPRASGTVRGRGSPRTAPCTPHQSARPGAEATVSHCSRATSSATSAAVAAAALRRGRSNGKPIRWTPIAAGTLANEPGCFFFPFLASADCFSADASPTRSERCSDISCAGAEPTPSFIADHSADSSVQRGDEASLGSGGAGIEEIADAALEKTRGLLASLAMLDVGRELLDPDLASKPRGAPSISSDTTYTTSWAEAGTEASASGSAVVFLEDLDSTSAFLPGSSLLDGDTCGCHGGLHDLVVALEQRVSSLEARFSPRASRVNA